MLTDRFGRPVTYLRISLTPRCNLRCVYCMPPEGLPAPPRGVLLSGEEITAFVRAAARLGIRRVRLTGGEPLVRRDVVEIVRAIAAVPGIEEVSLTTNAMLLAKKAAALAQAGLSRVNVSLDTLDAGKFHRITRGGRIERVFEGLAAAERCGLQPLKLNTVVVRGLNDDELPALARLTLEKPWHVRFIELMPVGNGQDWGTGFPPDGARYFPVREMRARLAHLGLQPVETPRGNGPARTFRIPGAPGTVGFISPLGEHFCDSCNRLRLTADGALRPCLLMDAEVSVREILRAGLDVAPHLLEAVSLKPEGHELALRHYPAARRMAQIGG